MISARPAVVLLAALLWVAGCATTGGSRGTPLSDDVLLRGGDIVLGIETLDSRRSADSRIVRYRRIYSSDGPRVEARTLLSADGVPLSVQVTGDGRWLAATLERGGELGTTLWRLREDGLPDPAWESPPGCREPSFDPQARFLVVACPPQGRQPAWLMTVGLPDLKRLALVGEWPRGAPVVGVEGDLYWVERRGSSTLVMRRAGDSSPYAVHELVDVVETLHPRNDGVLVAAVRDARGGLETLELQPSGVIEAMPLPPQLGLGSPTRLLSNARGDLLAIRCLRGDCAVVEARVDGHSMPAMTVSGRPVALSMVRHTQSVHPRPEDLATAPDTVLATHLSSDVSVLGVGLGMRLDEAWRVLEGAGLHPWWETPAGSRARPRAIGIGRAAGSWCIEFQADERGLVSAVDMRDCAAPYVSSALQPLLDRKHLLEGAYGIAQHYLGPGVSVEVGDSAGGPGESRSHPVRRTTLQYSAPERGYAYHSETEVLESRSR
ncbi:MAG: hypothetical protein KDA24_24770, partial [Deltaproteobacteria bacterium]|nr:hypothetical protein [Deltaproteobacteria bacterium]